MVIKNANQIREGQQLKAQGFGVAAGDEEGGGYTGNKSAGNKGQEKNPPRGGGSNNNNEWQNPDAALMSLMTDPAKLTQLRNQREGEQHAQTEGVTPETAQYLKSVLYIGGGSSTNTATSSSTSSNSGELSFLAKRAETIRDCIDLANQYPNVTKYGAPALGILVKGVSGAVTGSAVPGVGTVAGFTGGIIAGVQGEIIAQGVNVVAGEKIGELTEAGIKQLAAIYKSGVFNKLCQTEKLSRIDRI